MLTAMRAVENVMAGTKHDLWAVNAESAYHEEHQEPEQPYKRVPSTQYEREPLDDRRKRPPPNGRMSDWPVSRCDAILILTLTEGVRTDCIPHGGGSGRIRR